MNKFFLFLFFCGCGLVVEAQPSRLIFYSENGDNFQIEMDGRMHNEIPSYYVKFDPIFSGKHVFNLSFPEQKLAPVKKIFSVKPGWEYTFLIQKKSGPGVRTSVYFKGQNYQVTGLLVWAENSDFVVRQISGINLSSVGADAFTPATSQGNVTNGNQAGTASNPNSFSGGSGATINYGATQGYASPSGYAGPTGTVSPCSKVSEGGEFETAISKVRDQGGTSDSKLATKDFLTKNCVNAAQARNLVSEFANENDRLEIAKFAWHRTVDRANFFVVYDSFADPLSGEDLKVYTQRNP